METRPQVSSLRRTETAVAVQAVRGDAYREHVYPIYQGLVHTTMTGVDGLVVTSDLQGRDRGPSPSLAGVAAATRIARWTKEALGRDASRFGVVLPGDYWASELNRPKFGGYGDVRSVWRAFADRFAWVVGVPGNHDLFAAGGERIDMDELASKAHVLDERGVQIAGLTIAGVGGCVGNPNRPFRFTEESHRERLAAALDSSPDVLVLHQGPPADGRARRGAEEVERQLLAYPRPLLVLCGHERWTTPLHQLGNCQILNAHESAHVLTCSGTALSDDAEGCRC